MLWRSLPRTPAHLDRLLPVEVQAFTGRDQRRAGGTQPLLFSALVQVIWKFARLARTIGRADVLFVFVSRVARAGLSAAAWSCCVRLWMRLLVMQPTEATVVGRGPVFSWCCCCFVVAAGNCQSVHWSHSLGRCGGMPPLALQRGRGSWCVWLSGHHAPCFFAVSCCKAATLLDDGVFGPDCRVFRPVSRLSCRLAVL